MCGIAGMISLKQNPVVHAHVVQMADELKHRGPDGEGYLITNAPDLCRELQVRRPKALVNALAHQQQLAFGFRRLSILDLSIEASQPMNSVSGRYWIVYNGEIYNHADLRKELTAKGYSFKTGYSDTEVLLNAYDCWGRDCLQKLNGMWAFCIWDTQENTFFLSRDRVGKQPLYYTIFNNTFYFASELNGLLANRHIPRQLDDRSVYDYLTYTNVPAPKTIFSNFMKMPAGHYAFFRPGDEITIERYWHPFSVQQQFDMSEQEAIDKIRSLLYESTRLRGTADVKVGMLLSGGLDSSINLSTMSKFTSRVKAYTVGFENKNAYKNEFVYARKVAHYFNADLTELVVSEKEFFDLLPQLMYRQDEPIADTANIPIYLVSREAQRDDVKVLLSGEGSDELFIGYEHWRLISEFEKLFRNKPVLASVMRFVHKNSMFRNKRLHYQDWAYKVMKGWPVFWSGTELRAEHRKQEIISGEFSKKIGRYHSFLPKKGLYDLVTSNESYDTFKWMTINDLQNRLPDQLLARLDRMMMAASVEGRNPFLDVNLIEFVLSVPSHLKVRNRTEKYLLKKAFSGILPSEIIYRPKDSFTVPLQNMFASASRRNDSLQVIQNFNKATGVFSPEYMKELSQSPNLGEFWNVLNLAMWYEQHR